MVRMPKDPLMRGYPAEEIPEGASIPGWSREGTVYRQVVLNIPDRLVGDGFRRLTMSDGIQGTYPPRYVIFAFPPGIIPDVDIDNETPIARRVGAERTPTPQELAEPGTMIRRWTEDSPQRGRVYAPIPCHEEQVVILAPSQRVRTILCRVCYAPYRLGFTPDGDGMWYADFYVIGEPYVLSRKRNGRSST